MSAYTIRRATLDDVAVIAQQRAGMFTDMGIDPSLIAARDGVFRVWLREKIEAGLYLGWLAVSQNGAVVAGAGLWFYDWVPSPLAPDTRRGYILNVYTEREQRRQGIARSLIEAILAYCRANGVETMLLHASREGRPIYEALGFVASTEMRLNL